MSTPYRNRIYEKRTSLGLSQRKLAKSVGTSQQQIQRIEAGVQTARLDLAVKIASALDSTLADLFPKVQRELGKKRGARRPKGQQSPLHHDLLAEAGIETDPRQWTLRIGFEGGREADYFVSLGEKKRLLSILRDATFDFLVFDTDTKRVAACRSKINYAQFLYDVGIVEDDEDRESYKVVVNFVGNNEPVVFDVDPDDLEAEKDDQGFRSQLQRVFFDIEGSHRDGDEVVWFDDEDGERVFLRIKQIIGLEVPLLCCEPALWRNHIENLDEGDGVTAPENHETLVEAAKSDQK